MAKELPYFKFEPSEWIAKDIQDCSLSAQGAFINICSYYWLRLGELKYATALRRHCENNEDILEELIQCDAIKVEDGMIVIDFLDKQLQEFKSISAKNSENARKRWEKKEKNATALRPQTERNAIREEKKREEERREDDIAKEISVYEFNEFWNDYNKKVDRLRCEKKFSNISEEDRAKIRSTIHKYIEANKDPKYRKNPQTYLNGQCWNDEIIKSKTTNQNEKRTSNTPKRDAVLNNLFGLSGE